MSRGCSVLMYHGLGDPAPGGETRYCLSEQAFAEHLHLLSRRGDPVSFTALLDGDAVPGSVVLTFDDGEQSVVTKALPAMRAHGLVGALFVTTGWIGSPGYVTSEELGALAEAGWTIGAHGVTHRLLSDLPEAELYEELVGSRETLQRILGRAPLHMSLPGGRGSREVVAAVRRVGFRSLCTSLVGPNRLPPDPYGIRRFMMLQDCFGEQLQRIADGDLRLLLSLQARQTVLGLAKHALGNTRYERWRAWLLHLAR